MKHIRVIEWATKAQSHRHTAGELYALIGGNTFPDEVNEKLRQAAENNTQQAERLEKRMITSHSA